MTRARDIANLGNNTTNLETLDTLYGDNVLTGRNLIINGAMTIDQRNGGSALTVNSASEFYAVDRFMGIGVASDGVYTLQQVSDAPDNRHPQPVFQSGPGGFLTERLWDCDRILSILVDQCV